MQHPSTAATASTATIVLTGFDPFGGDTVNPSTAIAQALHGQRIAGHAVVAAQLPTAFGAAQEGLRVLVQQHQPALVLCLGQAGGRAALSIERVAINLVDARIPDNQGQQPVDAPVLAQGPAAYFATVPVKAMLQAVRACGLPGEVSLSGLKDTLLAQFGDLVARRTDGQLGRVGDHGRRHSPPSYDGGWMRRARRCW